jgi:hypothetical protein
MCTTLLSAPQSGSAKRPLVPMRIPDQIALQTRAAGRAIVNLAILTTLLGRGEKFQ